MKKISLLLLALALILLSTVPAYATDGTETPVPQDDTIYTVLICVGIGLAVGLTVTLLMKRGMSTVRKQQRADDYAKGDSFSLTEARDLFLYSTVTRVRINNSNNNR